MQPCNRHGNAGRADLDPRRLIQRAAARLRSAQRPANPNAPIKSPRGRVPDSHVGGVEDGDHGAYHDVEQGIVCSRRRRDDEDQDRDRVPTYMSFHENCSDRELIAIASQKR